VRILARAARLAAIRRRTRSAAGDEPSELKQLPIPRENSLRQRHLSLAFEVDTGKHRERVVVVPEQFSSSPVSQITQRSI